MEAYGILEKYVNIGIRCIRKKKTSIEGYDILENTSIEVYVISDKNVHRGIRYTKQDVNRGIQKIFKSILSKQTKMKKQQQRTLFICLSALYIIGILLKLSFYLCSFFSRYRKLREIKYGIWDTKMGVYNREQKKV